MNSDYTYVMCNPLSRLRYTGFPYMRVANCETLLIPYCGL